jgi:putative thioredoxin
VIDVTSQTFETLVVEQSAVVPVVVDFWAAWCGPCRLLSPVLEKLAREYDGKFILAKVDIDRDPEVAGQFGVRSIPAVFGVRDGQAQDGFVGVQPESFIRAWISRLLPSPAETLAAAAHKLELAKPGEAESKYNQALALQPDLPQAQIGLARMAFAKRRLEEAAARIADLERRGFLEDEAQRLKAEITLSTQSQGAGDVDAARAALNENPNDFGRKLALAQALAADRQHAEALAVCLELVERDRKGVGERARQTMLAIFQLLPPGDPLVSEYQRQLSLVL